MLRNDLEYYRARALTEREAAPESSEPHIAAIHLELAQHYEAIIKLNGKNKDSGPSMNGL